MDIETIQITLPSSKSLSNRWLMLDFMSRMGIKIKNISTSNDTQQLGRLLHQLRGGRRHNFDCRDAGTAARFMLALLSVTPGTHTLTGSEQLCTRPMGPLIDALRTAGCQITCTKNEGFLPVKIEGVMPTTQRIVINCDISSQFASAVLLSAVGLPQGAIIELTGEYVSEPYIQMTLKVMELAKVNFTLKGVPPAYYVEHSIPQCDVVAIEKDWSAASYMLEAASFLDNVPVRLPGLTRESLQGDVVARDIYTKLGMTVSQGELSLEMRHDKNLAKSFEWDFARTPDLVPAVAVTCAAHGIEARLTGVSTLKYKESNRQESIVEGLNLLGCKASCDGETILIPAGTPFTAESLKSAPVIDSHNDHRIAMAFGALKLICPSIEVSNPECVAKSFPDFWKMLERLMF